MNRFTGALRLVALSAATFSLSVTAMAAGYEKALTWDAKAASMGGAVVGSVSGAAALYFNPAGLVKSTRNGEISLNFSPTLSKFSGVLPFDSSAGSLGSATGFSPVGGIVASYRPTSKLGIGFGYFVSGGNEAEFDNVDYSSVNAGFAGFNPTVQTHLSVTEASLGAGYEIAPGLRFGFAWRYVMIHAKLSTVILESATQIIAVNLNNISANRWNGFRTGLQYTEPHHRWGLGLNFRSSVSFTAKGDTSGTQQTSAGSSSFTNLSAGAADVDNTFPLQIALGGWTRATELLRIGYEYSYTNYAQDRVLAIRGQVGNNLLSDIPQHWENMHILRLGGEYTRFGLPLRFGYAFTSEVTPADNARATFASPGPGHSFSFGSGMILNNNIDVDGALEYAFASGTSTSSTEVPAGSSFSSHAYVAHLSAKYRF